MAVKSHRDLVAHYIAVDAKAIAKAEEVARTARSAVGPGRDKLLAIAMEAEQAEWKKRLSIAWQSARARRLARNDPKRGACAAAAGGLTLEQTLLLFRSI